MDNRVKLYRQKNKWSQRQLAEAAGTSQQQIQRIEYGSPVKLNLAVAIAEALHVPLSVMFLSSKAALDRFAKEGRAAVQSEEAENSLLRSGIEVDPMFWTAKVLVRGHEVKDYPIGVADARRAEEIISNDSNSRRPEDTTRFFVFSSDDREVAINLDHLIFWHNCFDSPRIDTQTDRDEFHHVNVYFAGIQKPFLFDVDPDETFFANPKDKDEEGQFRGILFGLELGMGKGEFIGFEDADAEVAHIKVDEIAILEVAKTVINPQSADEDVEERGKDSSTLESPPT
jgi:transcriptional regulator with XRE-family HTH domain